MTMRKIDFLKKYCDLRNKNKLKTENKYYNSTIKFKPAHDWLDFKFTHEFKATYIYNKKYNHTLMWITNRGWLLGFAYNEMNEEGILIKIPGKLENNWFKEPRFEPMFNYLYNKHEEYIKESA